LGSLSKRELVDRITELLDAADVTVAVAESLTGGMVASALAEASGASKWFRGAVVAYASEVKHELLGVPPDQWSARRPPKRWPAGSGGCWQPTWQWP
jgi:nicotinamide mononucleotide (NMN) deamidase PncC